MGERKGTNKYYPPDYDPKKGGLNKFMGTHALRERARKLHLGILIIRFEMPYNIWCEGCNNHIGMGVRYNAEKTKIGMYYSTPVYQFRMKCHLCDNHFEIKTDPANLDYVIVSGARRQERRWDPTENGQVVPDDKQVIHKLADDAMFKLEHGVEDQKKMKDVTPTLSKLENMQERWKDDYMANKALREIFRKRKHELQEQQNKDKEFLKKRSMDIPLLQESDDDAKVASLIRLQPAQSLDERQQDKRAEIDKRSLFPFPLLSSSKATSSSTSSELDISKTSNSQTCLEQRRLSLGIKVKNIPSATATSSTISESEEVCKDIHKSSCVDIQAVANMTTAVKKDAQNPTDNDNSILITSPDSTEKMKKCCGNPDNSTNKKTGASLSLLVSYSDNDSEHSSDTSGSENNDES